MKYEIININRNKRVGSKLSESEAKRINKSGTHKAIPESEYLELVKLSKGN